MTDTTTTQDSIGRAGGPLGGDIFVRAFLILYMLAATFFYAFISMALSPFIAIALFIPILFFVIALIVDVKLLPLAVFAAMSLFIIFQIFQFARVSTFSLNLTSFAQCYGPLGFVIAYYYVGTEKLAEILRFLFILCFCYVCAYCVLVLLLQIVDLRSFLSQDASYFLVRGDIMRGDRILYAHAPGIFALFYSILNFLRRKRPVDLAMAMVAVTAFALALSRTASVVIILMFAVYFGTRSRRLLAWTCVAIYCAGFFILFSGIADPAYNPYRLFMGDDLSTGVRADSYDIVRLFLASNPILGVGFDGKIQNMYDLTANSSLNTADLGPLGIYFNFGLVGVILFSLSALLSCFMNSRVRRKDNEGVELEALFLMGCFLGAYSFTSPDIWLGDGGPFFAIILAQFVRGREDSFGERRTLTVGSRRTRPRRGKEASPITE